MISIERYTMTGSEYAITMADEGRVFVLRAIGGDVTMTTESAGSDQWPFLDGETQSFQNPNMANHTFYFTGTAGVYLYLLTVTGLLS